MLNITSHQGIRNYNNEVSLYNYQNDQIKKKVTIPNSGEDGEQQKLSFIL